jgi:hypothetical protein
VIKTGQTFTFDWPLKSWFSMRFLALFFASASLHAAAFFVFQIVEKSGVRSPSRERGVTVLSYDIPEHRLLLESVQSEAPTMALSHKLLPVDDLLSVPYRSSLALLSSELRDAASPRETDGYPVPVAMRIAGETMDAASQGGGRIPNFAGRVVFSEPLSARKFTASTPVPKMPRTRLILYPEYLVGVSPQGNVQFVMLQKSSGSEEADSEGEAFLRGVRFESRGSSIEWAKGGVFFGNPSDFAGH